MKKRSCGFLLEYGNKFLLVKSSGGNVWGIPKGVQDEGETDLETAAREVEEETGIKLPLNKLKKAKLEPFIEYSTARKNFVVFRLSLYYEEFTRTLKCDTLLENGKPEVDAFAWVDKNSAITLVKYNHTRHIFEQV